MKVADCRGLEGCEGEREYVRCVEGEGEFVGLVGGGWEGGA